MLDKYCRDLKSSQFEELKMLCHILSEFKWKENKMLYWAIVCFVIAVIAGVLGFGGIAGAASGIAQILFFIFIVLLVISLIANAMKGKGPKI
jgi:uncharacterized membrane protein YtjA (UPF0391 family)